MLDFPQIIVDFSRSQTTLPAMAVNERKSGIDDRVLSLYKETIAQLSAKILKFK